MIFYFTDRLAAFVSAQEIALNPCEAISGPPITRRARPASGEHAV